jgi:site-specific DNA-methyltransferase (adenine-specific)
LDEEAAALLDEQSGISGGYYRDSITTNKTTWYGAKDGSHIIGPRGYKDIGGASRFFYTSKASSSERNKGIHGLEDEPVYRAGHGNNESDPVTSRFITKMKNNHPTVKPLDLMEYLCMLVTPPGGLILDPFAGSGTTIKAAMNKNFQAIGFEIDETYTKIANKRLYMSCKPLTEFDNEKVMV